MSLNVRGIRDITKRKAFFLFCKRSDADLVLLQETHSSDADVKFWNAQWGSKMHFSHGTNNSAGVLIASHRFKGDVLEMVPSSDGRWVALTIKLDNAIFIVCNVYGFNSHASNSILFRDLSNKLKNMKDKYKDAYIILSGDLNECPNDLEDRFPPRVTHSPQGNNLISSLCSDLSLSDAWRFFNPNLKDFTWSNRSLTLKSRIDLFLISSSCLQFVKEIKHIYAPLTDHKQIILKLGTNQDSNAMRGYWKFNNSLLADESFNNSVKQLVKDVFHDNSNKDYGKVWEYFKFQVRLIAIKRSKELKKERNTLEADLMNNLSLLLSKETTSSDDEIELRALQIQLDNIYLDIAKGAFIRSRAKWLEEGERNTSYFFALEKRNAKRKSLTALNIDGKVCQDPKVISNFVTNFYGKLYESNFNQNKCSIFIDKIKQYIPPISDDLRVRCDSELLSSEIQKALFSMQKGKSPGVDGLSVSFYVHFWDFIRIPLLNMYNECISNSELTTTMKQGVISLIPKPDKDSLFIDNWRPITLLNIDYKILASVYANRLKTGLDAIIGETQTGFMKNRHISGNIRLVLDLIDYADNINSDAFILFLDFYKAFDTIEHKFLIETIKTFGFGSNFSNVVSMFYKDINSSAIIKYNTSQRFQINRGVRQGCNFSPFLFILVTELLAINILKNVSFEGINIFGRELKMSQLADDTTIFLKDQNQLGPALDLVDQFSDASGLKLNRAKCELLPLHNCVDKVINNIPVKDTVKYLGIYVTRDMTTRQDLNFSNRLQKTKMIFNCWLQRDLSILGRVLLSKAEGLSRFVYPSLSLWVKDSTAKNVSKAFIDFIWKNRSHRLKKDVISNSRAEGGLETLDFLDTINTFKITWLKKCILNPESIYFFIPNFIFNKLGGLDFLLRCNFIPDRLPVKLSNFHQQALMAWKMSFVHNFSPHKCLLWNNGQICVRNKSLFLNKWFQKNINHVICFFDDSGNVLSYEHFMAFHNFPIPFREYKSVLGAIPNGIIQLIKSDLTQGEWSIEESSLMLNGTNLLDKKCSNKHIRQSIQRTKSVVPRGKFYWRSLIMDIDWKKAWLLPYKFCISNKVREVHFKLLHNIYPTNSYLAKFTDSDAACRFCVTEDDSAQHIFFECNIAKKFWSELESHVFQPVNLHYSLSLKDVICYYCNSEDSNIDFLLNFLILHGKYFIHKQFFAKTLPNFTHFLAELKLHLKSLLLVNNKKNDKLLKCYNTIFPESP